MHNSIAAGESLLITLGIAPEQLKAIKSHWKRTHFRAVVNWLTKYQPPTEASNLENLKGYLEAFNHLCQAEEWVKANQIRSLQYYSSPEDEGLSLSLRLGRWGYHQEKVVLYEKLLGKVDKVLDSIYRNELGNAYYNLGQYSHAIEYHTKQVKLAGSNSKLKGSALLGLGNVYFAIGNQTESLKQNVTDVGRIKPLV
ncbi:tetratricopeptide repeat protein [Adonisia turfae]|uniref:Uncharacterized protein n=1 Tax=Adonisia turfae CCMR0081 TaxID=2292702 RepID=A0A6M0RDV6_9CYAN|nr:tetratricopeptide repeat protein [Adonisia turfae]NEZ54449.1 hypothetical protein [Adonisia turfae CCMR0081]